MAAARPPLTQKQLEAEDALIDRAWGRRMCPVHPQQEMIPLLPGLDTCPCCEGTPQG